MQCEPFTSNNTPDFWKRTISHEWGHVMQYMDIFNDPNFTVNGMTGTASQIMLNSKLTGEKLENLFLSILDAAEAKIASWDRDFTENNANKRGRNEFGYALDRNPSF